MQANKEARIHTRNETNEQHTQPRKARKQTRKQTRKHADNDASKLGSAQTSTPARKTSNALRSACSARGNGPRPSGSPAQSCKPVSQVQSIELRYLYLSIMPACADRRRIDRPTDASLQLPMGSRCNVFLEMRTPLRRF